MFWYLIKNHTVNKYGGLFNKIDFTPGGLIERGCYSRLGLIKLTISNNTSISSSPSSSSSISISVGVASAISPKIATNGFTSGLKQWIWSSSSPSSAVVNAQDLNDFRMVSHEILFHALKYPFDDDLSRGRLYYHMGGYSKLGAY